MVESLAKTEQKQTLQIQICPVFNRLGLCLESSKCQLTHPTFKLVDELAQKLVINAASNEEVKATDQNQDAVQASTQPEETKVSQQTQGGMRVEAAAFVPSKLNTGAQSFVPQKKKNVPEILRNVDTIEEGGVYTVKQQSDCTCCKGQVNNCRGPICADLGMCYCVYHSIHSHNQGQGKADSFDPDDIIILYDEE